MLERLDVADLRILSGWLQVQVPISTFSEHTCSRDYGVSIGIVSCHPIEVSVVASVVHHSMEYELQ